jgi:hypothetical protein
MTMRIGFDFQIMLCGCARRESSGQGDGPSCSHSCSVSETGQVSGSGSARKPLSGHHLRDCGVGSTPVSWIWVSKVGQSRLPYIGNFRAYVLLIHYFSIGWPNTLYREYPPYPGYPFEISRYRATDFGQFLTRSSKPHGSWPTWLLPVGHAELPRAVCSNWSAS